MTLHISGETFTRVGSSFALTHQEAEQAKRHIADFYSHVAPETSGLPGGVIFIAKRAAHFEELLVEGALLTKES